MEVHWLEKDASSVPAGDAWLSASERARLAALRIPKRRADWRLGRWTAKCALSLYWSSPLDFAELAAIELPAAPSGAPEVFLRGRPAAVVLSLSHSQGRGLCAISGTSAVGCDLESIEQRSPAFLADFFTDDEQKLAADTPARHRDRLVTLLWSAKESALKALGCGLRADTRCVNVLPESLLAASESWSPLSVNHSSGKIFRGWWSESRGLVRTIVAQQEPG